MTRRKLFESFYNGDKDLPPMFSAFIRLAFLVFGGACVFLMFR